MCRSMFVGICCLGITFFGGCGDDSAPGTESGIMDCQDGTDNDGDGLIDCNDTDCLVHPWCAASQETAAINCRDGIDNDGDQLIDCADPSCGVNDFCQSCPGCRIGPTCFDEGALNPANSCQVCNAATAADAWTNDDGRGCDDGSFCNGGDTCAAGACTEHAGNPCVGAESCDEAQGCLCPGCVILSTCHVDGTPNPDNGCQVCDMATADDAWTDDDGAACDDGLFCNGDDTCSGGACDAHAGDPCGANETCDEGGGQCSCPGCVIGTDCYPDGAANPANPCEACDLATSATAWTNNDGASCDDGTFCNGPDTCSGGTCAVHPGDPCTPFGCDETNDVCLAQDINLTDGSTNLPDGTGSYNYGQAVVGSAPLLHGFVIENTGNLDLTVTSVALTSGDLADFTLGAVATPLTIPASSSVGFDITFEPLTLGAKSVEVTLLSNDPDEATYTFTVAGTGATQPANTWTNQATATAPTAAFSHSMVHVGGGTIILFGGKDDLGTALGETWQYTTGTNTWAQLSPVTSPSARDAHDMVFVGNNTALLFGGKDSIGDELSDTWTYNATTNVWTQLTPTGSPSPRFRHAMAYVGGDLVVLFGGKDDTGVFQSDTWEYDVTANTWTQATPAVSPTYRVAHKMASGGTGVAVMHGGVDDFQTVYADTWEYTAATDTWTQITAATSPAERMNHELVSLGNGFLLLYSGKGFDAWGDAVPGTWVYNLASQTWTNMNPSLEPQPVFAYGMAPMGGGSAIIFGGSELDGGGNYSTDTWRYDY